MGDTTPNTNNDTLNIIGMGEHNADVVKWRSLMQFDFSSIPPTAAISHAALSLTINNDLCSNARTLSVYRCKRAWSRTTSTWLKYEGANAWQVAGANGADDRETSPCGSLALSASETGTKVVPLTPALIQEMISGVFTNNGFVLNVDTEIDDGYLYESLESATPGIRPLITIHYDEGGFISISPYMMV
jgi:hypothetical protein